jgi:hypothetical protein
LLNGSSQPIKSTFPKLFSLALEENIKASEVFGLADLSTLFYMPSSQQAFIKLQELEVVIRQNPLIDTNDFWT